MPSPRFTGTTDVPLTRCRSLNSERRIDESYLPPFVTLLLDTYFIPLFSILSSRIFLYFCSTLRLHLLATLCIHIAICDTGWGDNRSTSGQGGDHTRTNKLQIWNRSFSPDSSPALPSRSSLDICQVYLESVKYHSWVNDAQEVVQGNKAKDVK